MFHYLVKFDDRKVTSRHKNLKIISNFEGSDLADYLESVLLNSKLENI